MLNTFAEVYSKNELQLTVQRAVTKRPFRQREMLVDIGLFVFECKTFRKFVKLLEKSRNFLNSVTIFS